jgi:multisubunit Na+/H+ antiporter MnhF subunit
MSMMYWLAIFALLPTLVAGLAAALRGPLRTRPLAIQFIGTIVCTVFVLMALAMQQPTYVDLALTLALLGLPGTFAYAFYMERWL